MRSTIARSGLMVLGLLASVLGSRHASPQDLGTLGPDGQMHVGVDYYPEHCARGIEPNAARIAELVERSLMLVTALSPKIGYDRAAEIAKKAHRDGSTLREAALALGYVSADDLDRWLRAQDMVGPRK